MTALLALWLCSGQANCATSRDQMLVVMPCAHTQHHIQQAVRHGGASEAHLPNEADLHWRCAPIADLQPSRVEHCEHNVESTPENRQLDITRQQPVLGRLPTWACSTWKHITSQDSAMAPTMFDSRMSGAGMQKLLLSSYSLHDEAALFRSYTNAEFNAELERGRQHHAVFESNYGSKPATTVPYNITKRIHDGDMPDFNTAMYADIMKLWMTSAGSLRANTAIQLIYDFGMDAAKVLDSTQEFTVRMVLQPSVMQDDVHLYQPFRDHFHLTCLMSTANPRLADKMEAFYIAQYNCLGPDGYNVLWSLVMWWWACGRYRHVFGSSYRRVMWGEGHMNQSYMRVMAISAWRLPAAVIHSCITDGCGTMRTCQMG
ncbi:hypothetical protein VOLCADRAFT_87210 [Volvox carteri f. nagariensis]|uniref:Uncharacterized protein n=1 Tax=Volvox carteri f. nagariensis TaxID=3068 RepID=D8TKG4_VOLCA|nr:uncharacterized protein VOLCADRAFT_87210 [Volvox carteri f. nagariensis]EFJ52242.1 hypothetical protein VOLCADRAFT_87210 [Volvox carteri f. nagariensis]|eukprot:XP_002947016.1 hypothetical protein VOLCADRAFT_87210 [Volvox carteri f. nagariensis]